MTGSTEAKNRLENYVVKPLGVDDMERAIDIWSIAFGCLDRVRLRSDFNSFLDEMHGAFYDDLLVSIVGVVHFKSWFGDKLVPLGGISGVACDPAHRRKGVVRDCMKVALQSLNDKHIPISTLWPFSYPFYEKMGYALADMRYQVTLNCSSIPDLGNSSSYRSASLGNCDHIKPIHDQWIKSNNLSLQRSNLHWSRHIANPIREVNIYASDNAYMFFDLKRRSERTIDLLEWAYLDEQAFFDGLSLLRKLDDLHFDKVTILTPEIEPFLRLGMTEPRMEIAYQPGVMARVVNTDAFVELFDQSIEAFTVEDPLGVSSSYGKPSTQSAVYDPGRLIQLVTGMLTDKEEQFSLANKLAFKKPFCAEFF